MFANFSAFNWKKERRNIFASSFYGFAYNLHVLELKDSKYVASVDDRKCMRLLIFWRPTEGGRKHASSLLAKPPSQPASCPLSHIPRIGQLNQGPRPPYSPCGWDVVCRPRAVRIWNASAQKGEKNYKLSRVQNFHLELGNRPGSEDGADIFPLKHESSIFRSVIQRCMLLLHDGTG